MIAATQGQPGAQQMQGPLIPPCSRHAVLAIGLARLLQIAIGRFVLTPNQVNLRERVEDPARRLAHELLRASNVEGPVQRRFGPFQVPEPHADLSQRRERHTQAVRRAGVLLQLDAAFRERQRLIVTVLHQRDVRLIAAHRGKDVAGVHEKGESLRMAQRSHRFVKPPLLSESDARERMDHREVPFVARGVKRRRGLRDVVPDDRGVADLPIAQTELVVGKPDRQRVVGALGLAHGFGQEGNSARRLAAGRREPAVHAPQMGEVGRIEPFVRFRRGTERLRRLPDIVLKQPGFGERAANLDLVRAWQPGSLQEPDEEGCRLSSLTPI